MQNRFNDRKQQSAITLGKFVGISVIVTAGTATANDLTTAITTGKAVVDAQLRTEIVDQKGIKDKANATTLRTRIGYLSEKYYGLNGLFEFENTTALIDDYTYPSGPNAGKFPLVADPEGSEVNQAYIAYSQANVADIKLGRQRIIYDNARFIGNVGWRQNEQTYDGASIKSGIIPKSVLNYAFLTQVNDVFGNNSEMSSHLLNFNYSGIELAKFTAYGYLLDYDKGTDTRTLGLSLNGQKKVNDSLVAMYRAQYAQMSDYADNNSGKDANYYEVCHRQLKSAQS